MPAANSTPTWDETSEVSTPAWEDTQPAGFQDLAKDQPLRIRPDAGLVPQQSTIAGGPRQPLATYGETMSAVQSDVETPAMRLVAPRVEPSEPRIQLPRIPIDKNDPWWKAAAAEVVNAAEGLPEFFTSDLGIASAIAGKLAPRLVSAGFTADLAHSAFQQAKQTIEGWSQMTPAQKAVATVDTLASMGLAGMTGAHAAGVKIGPTREEKQAFLSEPTPKVIPPEAKALLGTYGVGFAPQVETGMVRTSPEVFGGGRLPFVPFGEERPAPVERTEDYASSQQSATPVGVRGEGGEVGTAPPLRQPGEAAPTSPQGQAQAPTPPGPPEQVTPEEWRKRLVPAVIIDGKPVPANDTQATHADVLIGQGKDPESIPHESDLRGFMDKETGQWYNRLQAKDLTKLKGIAHDGGLDSTELPRVTDVLERRALQQPSPTAPTGETPPVKTPEAGKAPTPDVPPQRVGEPDEVKLTQEEAIRKLLMQTGGPLSGAQKAREIARLAKERGVTVKQMQEIIEAQIVSLGHEITTADYTPEQKFGSAVGVYDRQPTMSARTSTSVEGQAYSTPMPLSVALNHALDVRPGTPIYDPTGGNGMLLIGGDLRQSHGNELNKPRADNMRKLGVGTVTENDATTYVPDRKYPVVKTNPPFGSIDNVNYGGYGIKRLEHLISLKALEAMEDNGHAALILGAKREVGEGGKGAQWVFENYLYGHYNVVGNFEVAGDLYAKQGAKWPVRVIVIDGRRANPIGGVLAPDKVDRYDNWKDVWKESDRIRHEIESRRQTLVPPGQPGLPVRPERPAAAPEKPTGVPPSPTGTPPTPAIGIEPRGEGERQPGVGEQPAPAGTGQPPVRPASKPEDEPPAAGKPVGRPGEPAPVEGGLRPSAEASPDVTSGREPGGAKPKPGVVPKPPAIAGTEFQTAYAPRSKAPAFGTLTPKNVAEGTHAALDGLQQQVGPLDEFVANRLNMSVGELQSGILAGEQVDGAALAIDQIERGGALIIGDETGIGKGRQGAAVIRYGKMHGKLLMFFTKDPKLFTDMYGDSVDIHTPLKPLIFGEPGKASIVDAEGNRIHNAPGSQRQKSEMARILKDGWENSGYDSIFVTYSQINTRNARQQFLERLAHDNDTIIILDEAHESAGDAETSMQAAFMSGGVVKRGSGPNLEKIAVPGLLNMPGTKQGRGGVVYMSATYAKRPENMPVYFRTSLSRAADSFGQIVEAMKRGGVALQQAVSESLAKVGQYIRRERDFSGVTYNMKRVAPENPEQLIDHVDQVTDVLTQIVDFSQQMRDAVVGDETSTAQSQSQIDMTDFASIVHNQVGQLLLAAKADAVVAEAIAAKSRGEKPVIAVMNTMESFLDHFVDDHGLNSGDPIRVRWHELLKHALERSLRTTTKNPDGSTTIGRADPDEVGLGDMYRAIQAAADGIESRFPVSPIDYILQKLRAAGVSMAELTGRESGIQYSNPEEGEGTYVRFKKANKNTVVNQFNGGQADGMLMNASGSTGLSAHASAKFKDQRPRHMIIGQPALDINVFVQTLGRIRRTGMVLLGVNPDGSKYGARYTHLVLPLQAEIRPAAIAAKKMKSLNANTTAEADNAIKIQAEDIMNKYGDHIVASYLDEHPELQDATGVWIERKEHGGVEVPRDVSRKFTGRMALRPDAEQEQIYKDIIPAYNELIQQLKATGDYDLEIAVHDDWDGKMVSDQQLSPGTDESNLFTASVRVQRWEIKDNRHVPTGEEMRKEFNQRTGGAQALGRQWDKTQKSIDGQLAQRRANLEAKLSAATKDAERNAIQTQIDRVTELEKMWQDTRQAAHHIIWDAGHVIELSNRETGEAYDAVMVDVKMPEGGLRVSPSNFKFKFAVDAPGGVLYLTARDFMGGDVGKWSKDQSAKNYEDLTGKKTGARYERDFIVGNPIRGYDATGGIGKVTRFTSQDGKVITGLLMPRNWSMGQLAKDPRLDLVSGKAAEYFLRNRSGASSWRTGIPIEAQGGIVRISKTSGSEDNWTVSVPSARRTGGAIYLDTGLRRLTGDFTKVGQRMTAEISTADLAKVIDKISDITKSRFRPVGKVEDLLGAVSESNRRGGGKGAMALPSVETRTPMSEASAWTHLESQHGIRRGGVVEVLNDPRERWQGQVLRDAQGKPYKLQLNVARIGSEEQLGWVIEHEVAHWFDMENRDAASQIKALVSTEEWLAIRDQAQRLGYDPDEVGTEIAARSIQQLAAEWRNRNWFQKLVGNIQRFAAERLGFKMTRLAAENAAVRALAQATGSIRRAIPDPKLRQVEMSNATLTEPGLIRIRPGGPRAIEAYHGTPHEVDRFSTEKVGTGEGAQVYGWGLYFAENEAVAKQYQQTLAPTGPKKDPWFAAEVRYRMRVKNQSWEDAYRAVYNLPGDDVESRRSTMDQWKGPEDIEEPQGYRYQVSIDAKPEEFLDWDRPLSQQSSYIRSVVSRELRRVYPQAQDEQFYGMTGAEVYRKLTDYWTGHETWAEKAASEKLAALQIPGIRYLDQGSRTFNVTDERLLALADKHNGNREAAVDEFLRSVHDTPTAKAKMRKDFLENFPSRTFNYVLFDDSKIKITAKNGQPVTPQDAVSEGALRSLVEPEGEEKEWEPTERVHQVAGEKIGSTYVGEEIEPIRQAVRDSEFHGNAAPISPETDHLWWEKVDELSSDFTKGQAVERVQRNAEASLRAQGMESMTAQMAGGLYRNELWDYAVRKMMLGEPNMVLFMAAHNQDFPTMSPADLQGLGDPAHARALRAAAERVLPGLWTTSVTYSKGMMDAAARALYVGPDLMREIAFQIEKARQRMTPEDLASFDDIIRHGKKEGGPSIDDILDRYGPERKIAQDIVDSIPPEEAPKEKRGTIFQIVHRYLKEYYPTDAGERFKRDIKSDLMRALGADVAKFRQYDRLAENIANDAWLRKTEDIDRKSKRFMDSEYKRLDAQAENTANAILRKMTDLRLRPGVPNKVRDILRDFLKSGRPIGQEEEFRGALKDALEGAGVPSATASRVAYEVYQKRVTDFVSAQARAMENASRSGRTTSLIEDLLNTPYLMQNDPKWRMDTAIRHFESLGLSRENAQAAAKIFDREFTELWAKNAVKQVERFLKNAKPGKTADLVKSIRLGLTDPTRQWPARIAEREGFKPLSPEQHQKVAELEQKLSNPDLSMSEKVDLREQMYGIFRHVGDPHGRTMRTIAEHFAATLLSGPSTVGLHIFQPAIHMVGSYLTNVAFEPRDFTTLSRALGHGLSAWYNTARFSWQKDAYVLNADKVGYLSNELKRLSEDAMADWNAKRYMKAVAKLMYGSEQYLVRMLQTSNQAGMLMKRDWALALYGSRAMRDAGFNTRDIALSVDMAHQAKKAAYETALDEGKTTIEAGAIADEAWAQQMKDFFANKVGDPTAMQIAESALQDAHIIVGRLGPGVKEAQEGMLSRYGAHQILKVTAEMRREGGVAGIGSILGFGFVSVPLRLTRYYAGWGPYGLVRYGVDAWRKNRGRETLWKQSYGTALQSEQRLREAVVGTALMLAFVGWQFKHRTSDDNALDHAFALYATGQGPKNRALNDAWRKRGFRPYSLHVVVNGQVMGKMPITRVGEILAYPLGLAAAFDDAGWLIKEHKAIAPDKPEPVGREFFSAIGTLYHLAGAQGIFQTFGHLVGLGGGADPGTSISRAILTTAGSAAAGIVVPWKSAAESATEAMFGRPDRSSMEAGMVANFPLVNVWANGVAVNRFGDALGDHSWSAKLIDRGIPFALRVADTPENRALYQLLLDKGAPPPDLRRSIIEQQYGPLTQEQWQKFAKTSGETLKAGVLSNLQQLQSLPPQAVRQFMTGAAEAANAHAAATLGLTPAAVGGGMASTGTTGGGGGTTASTISLPRPPRTALPTPPSVGIGGGRVPTAGAGRSSVLLPQSAPAVSVPQMALGGVGRSAGMPRRSRLSYAAVRPPRLVSGRLRARSGRVRRVRLSRPSRRHRISYKG